MIRHFDFTGQILGAGDLVWKHRGQQILGIHACDLRRYLFAAAKPRQGERNAGVPAPSDLEHRRCAQSLDQHLPHRMRIQITGRFRQFKAVGVREREHDVIFGGRGLQFEVEGAAESFAQRQAPCPVHPAAERRMNDQLHTA